MPSFLEITPDKLNRIIGTPNALTIVDVRNDEDFSADPRLVPGSIRRDYRKVTEWADELSGPFVVLCQKGQKLGHGVAAHLRALGKHAEVLEGGFEPGARLARLWYRRTSSLPATVAAGPSGSRAPDRR